MPKPPCPVHRSLAVELALDGRNVLTVRRADVTVTCDDCGHEVFRGDRVPVTVTERPADART